MTDSLRELLPCPFCGSSACVDFAGKAVTCGNASCDARSCVFGIEAWNRRALLAEATPDPDGLLHEAYQLIYSAHSGGVDAAWHDAAGDWIKDAQAPDADGIEGPLTYDELVERAPPGDQGLRGVAQRLLAAIDRAMVEDDDLPDGIDGTLIDDLREALVSKKGGEEK
jgi:hypothetical protein